MSAARSKFLRPITEDLEDAFEPPSSTLQLHQKPPSGLNRPMNLSPIEVKEPGYQGGMRNYSVAPVNAPSWMTALPNHKHMLPNRQNNNKQPFDNAQEIHRPIERLVKDTADLSKIFAKPTRTSRPLSTSSQQKQQEEEKHDLGHVPAKFNLSFFKYWLTKNNPSLFLFRTESITRTGAIVINNSK